MGEPDLALRPDRYRQFFCTLNPLNSFLFAAKDFVVILTFYAILLIVPGGINVWLSGVNRHRFLIAVTFSVAVLTLTQLPFRYGGGSLQNWLFLYLAVLAATWITSWVIGKRVIKKNTVRSYPDSHVSYSWFPVIGVCICLLLWGGLYSLIGPYTEVPADFWNHLVRIRWEYGRISQGEIPSYSHAFPPIGLVNREYIHGLHAGVRSIFDIQPEALIGSAQLATTSIFIAAVFWFIYAQVDKRWSEYKQTWVTMLATILTVGWMGTGAFAFVRYYALGPVMLTLPLFFLGVLIFIDHLRDPERSTLQTASILGLIFLNLALLHVQEAIFLAVILPLIVLIARLQIIGNRTSIWPIVSYQRIRGVFWLFFFATIVTAVALLILLEPREPSPGVLLTPRTELPVLRDIWIVDPARQVWATITLGGCLAYLLLIILWRPMQKLSYVIAAMVLPLVTLFNPLFIHIWERLLSDYLLWRFSMLLPAGLVAGIAIGVLTNSSAGLVRWFRVIPIAACIVTLLPIASLNSTYIVNRAFSFEPLQDDQSIQWLSDLVEFLRTQPRQLIQTDPVTSYVLRGLTQHILPGEKFYPHTSGVNFRKMSKGNSADHLNDGMIVINLRNGSESKTARVLGHWAENELEVSRFYPNDILGNLIQNGYQSIWSSNEVTVFVPQQ